jgi:hypothetical protein
VTRHAGTLRQTRLPATSLCVESDCTCSVRVLDEQVNGCLKSSTERRKMQWQADGSQTSAGISSLPIAERLTGIARGARPLIDTGAVTIRFE